MLPSLFAIGNAAQAADAPRGKCNTLPTEDFGYRPSRGLVPDANTAIAIARVIGNRAFGVKAIKQQEPLVARQFPKFWEVEGSIHPDASGGVIVVRIAKTDARVLYFNHGK
jgi:hypothetical protein